MDSFCTKLKSAGIFTAAICISVTLSLGDETGNAFRPTLSLGKASEEYIVLAQNTATPAAAPAPAPAAKKDTVYIQAPAATTNKHALSKADMDELMDRYAHFDRMQSTGFGLLMGGIGCGAGGLLLMITGINEMDRNNHYDPYTGEQTNSDKGVGTFIVGYIALLVGCPALVTTGIILNRVGNHKKLRTQDEIEESGGHVDVNIGLNSMRLSYSF